MLLGVTGAGKSPTANAILGQEAFTESRTRASEEQRGRVENRNISIIDTPGFFNTHLTDEEMKKQMIKSLYLSDPGPHVFLLVINLETFREEQRNIVEKIQENFGEKAFLFTMVLFIGREKVSRREFNQIIKSEATQKILNYFEGRFHAMNSSNECGLNQIMKLLKSIDKMMKKNKGQNYSNEIYLKNQRKLKEHKRSLKKDDKRLNQEEDRMKQEQAQYFHPKSEVCGLRQCVQRDPKDTVPVPYYEPFKDTTHTVCCIQRSFASSLKRFSVSVFNGSNGIKVSVTVCRTDTIGKLQQTVLQLRPDFIECGNLAYNGKPVQLHQTLSELQVKPGAVFITYQKCHGV
ncbi:GTPase IMAP family member 8-like protein [Labeo rohita]|uniref:GTPase IMAP family member 8 n=1 Tax=Labeo rohita TaxID=84645 RepID=A0A498M0T6_LABRO|nr:GTPase IMAP family member 8-like protein [Labeo rohita]RXN38502.1 GTPase IMAP family member 8-like protein [Labeo rohita]